MAAAPRFWDALLTGVCSCVNHAVYTTILYRYYIHVP